MMAYICIIVSVEPLPKQGCEKAEEAALAGEEGSQWNPCRSRGARGKCAHRPRSISSLSGTPAEAGVRDGWNRLRYRETYRLSGTPAEAGVRVVI